MGRNKIKLESADRRIDISDYTLKEYGEYLKSFDGKILVIETEKRILKIAFHSENMCHLIGFQYAYDREINKNHYKGKFGMELMLSGNFSFFDFDLK